MSTAPPLLEVRDLEAGYGPINVLHKLSLVVNQGEIVTIIGANGAGKTTLLNAICGVVKARAGEVVFNVSPEVHARYGSTRGLVGSLVGVASNLTRRTAGVPVVGAVTRWATAGFVDGVLSVFADTFRLAASGPTAIHEVAPHNVVKLGLAQSPEGRKIFPRLTVRENLEMGAFTRSDKAGIAQDLQRVIELFPILGERRAQAGGTLSGGEQQMLAVGRAMMSRPKLLLLDEPSLGLAPLIVMRIFEVIRELNRGGTTILLVEQNARMALKCAHRGYVLETGTITMTDSADTLLADERVRSAYLGDGA